MNKNKKVLIITGASQGIGLAVARKCLKEGATVINLSRSDCPEPEVVQLKVDLGNMKEVEGLSSAFTDLLKEKKQTICLVHNAFSFTPDTIDAPNAAYLQLAIQLGIMAPMMLNKILIPLMGEGSSILYIGSTLSLKAVAHTATYSTIKHAMVGAMRATCQDLTAFPIHTACICPGFTDTIMLKKYLTDRKSVDAVKAKVGANRLISPDEIAEVILFCSKNPVVNGTVIQANLGQIEG